MKRTTSPKTKVFYLRPASFCCLMSCFKCFHYSPHSRDFRDFVMAAPYYQDCVRLSDFLPSSPVKNIKLIFEYE